MRGGEDEDLTVFLRPKGVCVCVCRWGGGGTIKFSSCVDLDQASTVYSQKYQK